MTDNVVAREVAEAEFDRFTLAMDLDLDESLMDVEDLTAFNKQKGRILSAIEGGHLVFNDDGEAVFTPSHKRSRNKDPLTFQERSGASLMAMDGKKKNHDVAKTYAVLADMCGVPPAVFAGLVGSDIKVCEALFALLMD
jgi:hypothetical protein